MWKSVGVFFWILGLLFISFLANTTLPSSSRNWDFDSDNALLCVFCFVFLVVVYPLLEWLKRLFHVQSRNFCFAILSSLLTIIVIIFHSWSENSFAAFTILTVGLAVNAFIAWFRRPVKGEGRFLKVHWFVLAAICAVLSLVSVYAIFDPKESWEDKSGVVKYGKDFHYTHRDIFRFFALDAVDKEESVGLNSFNEIYLKKTWSNVCLLFHDYDWYEHEYAVETEYDVHVCYYGYCMTERVFSLYGYGLEEEFVDKVISPTVEAVADTVAMEESTMPEAIADLKAENIVVDESEKIRKIENKVRDGYMTNVVVGTLFFMVLTVLFIIVGLRQKNEK